MVAACAQPYVPAGIRQRDVSGTYATAVSLFSTTCSGVSVRDTRIIVEHAPGAATLKLTHENLPFDGKIRSDGNFTTPTSAFRDGMGAATAYLTGRFTDSSFNARVYVKSYRGCEYQLRWAGRRL